MTFKIFLRLPAGFPIDCDPVRATDGATDVPADVLDVATDALVMFTLVICAIKREPDDSGMLRI